jgi:hypothetical protein
MSEAHVADEGPPSRRAHTLIACLVLSAVGLLLLAVEWWCLHRRHEAQAAAAANEEVAARVESARAHLERREWDDAARLLEEALAVEHATATEEAQSALLQARRGQADGLLERARAAAERDVTRALDLLAAYLAHPQAANKEGAAHLQAEINRALSGPAALRCLAAMSDAALARLERGAAPEGLTDPAVRDLFADTLRRHLPQELARRAQLRAARADREAQLRLSPAFRELARFIRGEQRARQAQAELAGKQERALALLAGQLNVTDPAELEQLRAGGPGGREEREALERRVTRKRDEVRRAFRREPGHDPIDVEAFDRLVEQELRALAGPAGR